MLSLVPRSRGAIGVFKSLEDCERETGKEGRKERACAHLADPIRSDPIQTKIMIANQAYVCMYASRPFHLLLLFLGYRDSCTQAQSGVKEEEPTMEQEL